MLPERQGPLGFAQSVQASEEDILVSVQRIVRIVPRVLVEFVFEDKMEGSDGIVVVVVVIVVWGVEALEDEGR